MKNLIKLIGLGLLVLSGILHSCEKEVPTVTTSEVTNITATAATCGGTIIDEGTGRFRVRGICWSKGIAPTIADDIISAAGPTVTFTYNMSYLDAGTTYYVRAYATNNAGTGYGTAVPFTTFLLDFEGNVYKTVTIGTQVWMAENLKTTKYNDGTSVPFVADATAWSELSTPGYCWYDNDAVAYKDIYGALYNWYTVDAASNGGKNICPNGWHVPTDTEWTTLTDFVGGYSGTVGLLKETGTVHWRNPNEASSNSTGFTALPGGYCAYTGTFWYIGYTAAWWSSSWWSSSETLAAWARFITETNLVRNGQEKKDGFSVRCLKD